MQMAESVAVEARMPRMQMAPNVQVEARMPRDQDEEEGADEGEVTLNETAEVVDKYKLTNANHSIYNKLVDDKNKYELVADFWNQRVDYCPICNLKLGDFVNFWDHYMM